MQITTKTESRHKNVFAKVLADLVGGRTLYVADLASTRVAKAGAPVGLDSNGIAHLVKFAKVEDNVAAAGTTIKVKKGHDFQVGDVIMASTGGKAYAITGIATDASDATLDDITIGTAIGAISEGAYIFQAAASGASGSAWKYAPVGMLTESYDLEPGDNVTVAVATMGAAFDAAVDVPAAIRSELKHISFQ